MLEPLNFERIPIERQWDVSLLLHVQLGHVDPWEICNAGCDRLASQVICHLFDQPEFA